MRFKHRKRVRKKRLQTRQDRILTLANAISISRIFLTIPLVLIFEDIAHGMTGKLWQAFVLIIIIVLTDFLDGYVARKAEEITNFGKLIDPVADKVCMMVVLIYLIISYKLPFLIFFLTLAIRALMMVLFLFKNPLNIPSYILWTSYLISSLLFMFSTFEYVRRYLRYFKQLETR